MRIHLRPRTPCGGRHLHARRREEILLKTYDVVTWRGEDREAFYRKHLPDAEVVISQQPMEKARLDLAPKLRCIVNVETNFLPNVDYEACFQRGIHVIAPSSVFAAPVAEIGLGMALSLARGIHTGAHGDFSPAASSTASKATRRRNCSPAPMSASSASAISAGRSTSCSPASSRTGPRLRSLAARRRARTHSA
jgi:lactate dehydrogenase-like 2-hydroxyacid dehydrogenase